MQAVTALPLLRGVARSRVSLGSGSAVRPQPGTDIPPPLPPLPSPPSTPPSFTAFSRSWQPVDAPANASQASATRAPPLLPAKSFIRTRLSYPNRLPLPTVRNPGAITARQDGGSA